MSAPSPPRRLLPGSPPELLVHDAPSPCPYLAGRVARLPLRLPIRALRPTEFDDRLANGDRRQGLLLYRTSCPSCQACEPIRIDVDRFAPNRSQRRVFRKGEELITTQVGPLETTFEKVALYNRHKEGRELTAGESPIDYDGYRAFLGESCCDSFELRYFVDKTLIGTAIVDRGEDSLSAVYCYFDPDYGAVSPGTYSVLKQIDLCRQWGLRYLYLGLYIAGSSSMAYKARFTPHERFIDGAWTTFDCSER